MDRLRWSRNIWTNSTDTLDHQRAILASGWGGKVLPTFRPDVVPGLDAPGWRTALDLLGQVSGVDVIHPQIGSAIQ
jgi:glucuronate isomerase